MLFASSLFDNLLGIMALYYPASPDFKFFQLITHIFMHGDFFHLLFNMYTLWMFGAMIESVWGGRKFLFYYLVTGVGAALFYLFILWLQITHVETLIDPVILHNMQNLIDEGQAFVNKTPEMKKWYDIIGSPMVGASGAVFGVLLAFGMMFPDAVLELIFPPVRLKAIWLVVIFGGMELLFGIINTGRIAHFAHVGGMLFGFIIIKYWKYKGTLFSNSDYNNRGGRWN
jgi:membrane associated rhomboid family serine protease